MLSAGSFSSPYEHLSQPETKRMVEHYTAYLSDNTRLIANPGLKVYIHTTFWVTHSLKPTQAWRDTHILSYTSLSPEWQHTLHYQNQAWRYTQTHKICETDWRKDHMKLFGTWFVFLHGRWNVVAFYDWNNNLLYKHQSVMIHAS